MRSLLLIATVLAASPAEVPETPPLALELKLTSNLMKAGTEFPIELWIENKSDSPQSFILECRLSRTPYVRMSAIRVEDEPTQHPSYYDLKTDSNHFVPAIDYEDCVITISPGGKQLVSSGYGADITRPGDYRLVMYYEWPGVPDFELEPVPEELDSKMRSVGPLHLESNEVTLRVTP